MIGLCDVEANELAIAYHFKIDPRTLTDDEYVIYSLGVDQIAKETKKIG